MKTNLLLVKWADIDSAELRLLLDERIGGPGQYDSRSDNPNKLFLPLARSPCRVALTFDGSNIIAIEPGPAFDPAEWERISEEVERSILSGTQKVGREYSFSSFRVNGSWRGERSGVQILPPPADAPRADVEIAEHPFILEVPIKGSDLWSVTNYRRLREHRRFTLLLNLLLAGRTKLQARQQDSFWGASLKDGRIESQWVNKFFSGTLGRIVLDELSPPADNSLEEIAAEEYYTVVGHDGKGLRVPADLDESICRYAALSPTDRSKFDRATFWVDIASRFWNVTMSGSFAALVSAIESLTERGSNHQFECPICGELGNHEVPGAIRRFKDFLTTYAPGPSLNKQRSNMYSLRSGILHGSDLMQLDQDRAFGWDPPGWNERDLHNELWSLTRVALRNWLKNPTAIASGRPASP